jgi:hypothetical protein
MDKKSKKRKRETSSSDSENEDVACMTRIELAQARAQAHKRLKAVDDREAHLDGQRLYKRCMDEMQEASWYKRLGELVLPGNGDEVWNKKLGAMLSSHLNKDLHGIVCGYATRTVEEACNDLVADMELYRRQLPRSDDAGFHLEIRVGVVGILARHIETDDGIAKTSELNIFSSMPDQGRLSTLQSVAKALRIHGVIPLAVLAAILFKPIVALCGEVSDACASVDENMKREICWWLKSSKEKDHGVSFVEAFSMLSDDEGTEVIEVEAAWNVVEDRTLQLSMFQELTEYFF